MGDPPQAGSDSYRRGVFDWGPPASAAQSRRIQGDLGTNAGAARGAKGSCVLSIRRSERRHPPDAPRGGKQRVWHSGPREAVKDAVTARGAGSHVPR